MVRHRLIPCGIVGQISYAQAKLLRDESGEIMGYRSPVAYQLREGDARMPQKGELQRDAQPVPSLPPRADDLNVRRGSVANSDTVSKIGLMYCQGQLR